MSWPGKENKSWERRGGGECGWQAGISGPCQVKGHLEARPLLDKLGPLFNSDILSNLQEFPTGLSYEILGGCRLWLLLLFARLTCNKHILIYVCMCMKQSTLLALTKPGRVRRERGSLLDCSLLRFGSSGKWRTEKMPRALLEKDLLKSKLNSM